MKRKVIFLVSKINILIRVHSVERVTDAAKFYTINEVTIRTMRKNEDSIRKSVAAGSSRSMKRASDVRGVAMENIEKALRILLEDTTQKRIPIDTNTITNKPLKIYEKIKSLISYHLLPQLKRSCLSLRIMVGLKDLNKDILYTL